MSFRCQALAEALKVNRSITHIDLCENQIGEVGAEASPGCQAPCPDRERSWAPFAPGAGRGGAGERRHPRDRSWWKSTGRLPPDARRRTPGTGGHGVSGQPSLGRSVGVAEAWRRIWERCKANRAARPGDLGGEKMGDASRISSYLWKGATVATRFVWKRGDGSSWTARRVSMSLK